MTDKSDITPEVLRQLLRYDPETGKLFWQERGREWFNASATRSRSHNCNAWNSRFAGKAALTADHICGYLHGAILGHTFTAHRVAMAVFHGEFPCMVDHINGDKKDNRSINLRAVTKRENMKNTKKRSDNESGVVGVSWYAATDKWEAFINSSDGRVRLGYFAEKGDAITARKSAEVEYGYHPNHGRS